VPVTPPKPAAEAPPKPVAAGKSLDDQYNERAAAECTPGFVGILCREKLRLSVCSDKWSESPPPGQSICKQNSNKEGKR
jgi:hypothetical protein